MAPQNVSVAKINDFGFVRTSGKGASARLKLQDGTAHSDFMARLLVSVISLGVRVLRAISCSRADLVIENVALHQQVATFIEQRRQPTLDDTDRAFWVALRATWPRWMNTLVIVKSDTVAKWHRERFRRHWATISRRPGRPRIDAAIRRLICEMATDGWGSPKMRQMAGLSPRDLQATRRSLPCRGSVVYIIVTLGAMPREQVSVHLSRESSSWTFTQIDFEERQPEQVLVRLHEPDATIQRYRDPDTLIDFLKTL